MKRIIIYIILSAVAFIAPVNRINVENLQPVEVIAIYSKDGMITVTTDADDFGSGKTISAAIENMKETATAVIYLDTAQYLLIDEQIRLQIGELRKYLKESVKVSLISGRLNLELASKYLETHGGYVKLKHWKPDLNMHILKNEILVKEHDNN